MGRRLSLLKESLNLSFRGSFHRHKSRDVGANKYQSLMMAGYLEIYL